MNLSEEVNERLREACCLGDLDAVYRLIGQGADVNSQNKMNGWTCLHWAAKRGHTSVIPTLIQARANIAITNNNGETASDVACNDRVKDLLVENLSSNTPENAFKPIHENGNSKTGSPTNTDKPTFIPNYISNPVFPYVNQTQNNSSALNSSNFTLVHPTVIQKETSTNLRLTKTEYVDDELVLKVRIANAVEEDFYEVELNKDELSFSNLISVCRKELGISILKRIIKVRKLPNTVVRKDKDVKRLQPFQEIELVVGDL